MGTSTIDPPTTPAPTAPHPLVAAAVALEAIGAIGLREAANVSVHEFTAPPTDVAIRPAAFWRLDGSDLVLEAPVAHLTFGDVSLRIEWGAAGLQATAIRDRCVAFERTFVSGAALDAVRDAYAQLEQLAREVPPLPADATDAERAALAALAGQAV